jgi:DNA-binding MarR family transcriptional regulator
VQSDNTPPQAKDDGARPLANPAHSEDDTLAEAFWSVARRLRHMTHDTVAPLGVTPGQARAIGVLRRHGGMRLSDLSDHLRIAPRSATEVVDALEHLGLADRTPDPLDRRATLVSLTTEGQSLGQAIRLARALEGESFFGRLSEADRAALTRILATLRQ